LDAPSFLLQLRDPFPDLVGFVCQETQGAVGGGLFFSQVRNLQLEAVNGHQYCSHDVTVGGILLVRPLD